MLALVSAWNAHRTGRRCHRNQVEHSARTDYTLVSIATVAAASPDTHMHSRRDVSNTSHDEREKKTEDASCANEYIYCAYDMHAKNAIAALIRNKSRRRELSVALCTKTVPRILCRSSLWSDIV